MKSNKYNTVKTLRVPKHILDSIGDESFTDWVLDAMKSKLQHDRGLTPDYEKRLTITVKNLIAIGRNLNQLTRTANSGKPVTINDELLKRILKEIQTTKINVLEVKSKL